MKIKWFDSLVQERKTEVYRYISLILSFVVIFICLSFYYIWNTIPEYEYEINAEVVSEKPYTYNIETSLHLNIASNFISNKDSFEGTKNIFDSNASEYAKRKESISLINGSRISMKVSSFIDSCIQNNAEHIDSVLACNFNGAIHNLSSAGKEIVAVQAIASHDDVSKGLPNTKKFFLLNEKEKKIEIDSIFNSLKDSVCNIILAREEYTNNVVARPKNILSSYYPDSLALYSFENYKHLSLMRIQCHNKNQSVLNASFHKICYYFGKLFSNKKYDVKFSKDNDKNNRLFTQTAASSFGLEFGERESYAFGYSGEDQFNHGVVTNIHNKPSFFSLYDISQASLDFHFQTNDSIKTKIHRKILNDSIMNYIYSIEDMSLSVDFDTPVNLLPIYPEPDEIGKTYIKYKKLDKIDYLYQNGLSMHAQFPVTQNIQTIRLFLLTAIISFALNSILVTIIAMIFGKTNHNNKQKHEIV